MLEPATVVKPPPEVSLQVDYPVPSYQYPAGHSAFGPGPTQKFPIGHVVHVALLVAVSKVSV